MNWLPVSKKEAQFCGVKMKPRGHSILDRLDIKRIRGGYKLTQAQFADLLGINVRTLSNWEQGRRWSCSGWPISILKRNTLLSKRPIKNGACKDNLEGTDHHSC
jgi:DNA-binding transcriptional regulator YiaG